MKHIHGCNECISSILMHNDERIMCVFIEPKKNIFIAIIIVIIMITAN